MKKTSSHNPYPLLIPSLEEIQIPSILSIGASSWTHQFWKGQIYHKQYKSEKEFNTLSLQEYSSLGLFNMVEIDSSFYAPPKKETLQRYAELTPPDFLFTAKVWEQISIPVFPNIKRYGKFAGQENLSFLNPQVFNEQFVPSFRESELHKKFASFLIQFPRMDRLFATSKLLLQKLETFLAEFPKDFRLAIELRNIEILSPAYIQLLNEFNVTHCFNQWFPMPSIKDQMKIIATAGGLIAPFYMTRLLTPSNISYDEAGKVYEPFHQIKQRHEEAREDAIRLVRRAAQRNVPAYVIINNRFEGNTPMTAMELRKKVKAQITC